MAYIKPEEEIEQQGVNQTMGQTQNEIETPQTVSGASVSTSTPTPTAASTSTSTNSVSTTPSPTARSGIYTNLQDYMQQNQPAAQNIAGKATEKIEGQAQQIGQQVQQQQSDFMNKVAENRTRLQQAQQTAQQQIQQAGQQEFDPASIEQTRQLAQGNFQMETPQFDVQEYQKQAEDIARMTDMGQTQQGRRELLTQAFRGPEQRYTQGQRSLDELILAGDPTARQRIAEAPKAASENIMQQITGAREQALADIAGLTTQQQNIQSQIAADINAAQEALKSDLTQRTENLQGIASQVQTGNITPEVAKMLGLKTFGEEVRELSDKYYQDAIGRVGQAQLDQYGKTADTYYQDLLKSFEGTGLTPESIMLYGVNPQQFLETPSTSAIATEADVSRAKALQALEGTTGSLGELGISDLGVVGTMTGRLTGTERLRSEIAAAKDALGQELMGEYFSYGSQNPLQYLKTLAPYVTGNLTGRGWEDSVNRYGDIFQSRLNPVAVKDGGMKKDPRKEALRRLLGK